MLQDSDGTSQKPPNIVCSTSRGQPQEIWRWRRFQWRRGILMTMIASLLTWEITYGWEALFRIHFIYLGLYVQIFPFAFLFLLDWSSPIPLGITGWILFCCCCSHLFINLLPCPALNRFPNLNCSASSPGNFHCQVKYV